MQTTTMFNNCITYEQLESYTSHKSDKNESARIYQHISTCELCACAVNGFAAIPFTSADVDAIHNQIDVRSNAAHANLLTIARVLIVIVSLASIFGFYKFADSFSKKNVITALTEKAINPILSIPVSETILAVNDNKIITENKTEKQRKRVENKLIEKIIIPVEPIENIPAIAIEQSQGSKELILEPVYNSDVIYIYDLKVTDYNNLYFKKIARQLSFGSYTPSFKENKETANNLIEKDAEQIVPANRVLKNGLEYFNKGRYNRAIEEFQTLLENNPKDVNALFYEAVSFYQVGNYNRAIKNLQAVLQCTNNTFHPEAKWNLALVNIKTGNKQVAKQLLSEIINEKGFYSKKAEVKLKGL